MIEVPAPPGVKKRVLELNVPGPDIFCHVKLDPADVFFPGIFIIRPLRVDVARMGGHAYQKHAYDEMDDLFSQSFGIHNNRSNNSDRLFRRCSAYGFQFTADS
jgi:hypothetical protein